MVARPDDVSALLADLIRRVGDLETAERLTNASMKNGRIRVLDSNDVTRVEVGTLSDWGNGAGDYGFAILTAQGKPVLLVDQDGYFAPYQLLPFAGLRQPDANGFLLTPLTTFDDIYRCDTWITAKTFYYDLQVDPLAGTSAEWQIQASIEGGAYTTIASASVPAGSSAQQAGSVNLVSALASNIVGRQVSLRAQAKRTGGSGSVGLRWNTTPVLRP